MNVQAQRGCHPLVPRSGTVPLECIAGVASGKGVVPSLNVISVMTDVRIVIHRANGSQYRQ